MSAPLLSVQDLDVRYGSVQALFDVSIDVPAGGVVAVLGANGAGKSTLARAVSGLVPPSAGSIRFDGEDITTAAPHRIRRAGLVHIPEGRGVFPGLTVQENLRMAVRRVGSPEQRRDAIDHAFSLFPRLAERRTQRAGTLSGGEQQMVAMGRALMSRPRLLLMDEPSMGLAPVLVEKSFEIIQQVHEAGVAMLVVEQNANMALSIADRGYVLSTGRVVLSDNAEALLAHEDLRKAYLGR